MAALAAPAGHASAENAIGVRFGDHPGFSRIVFDWPREIDYKVEKSGGQAIVRFSAASPIDAAALAKLDLVHVRKATARTEGKVQRVDIVLGEGVVDIHHFRAGAKVVVDFRSAAAVTTAAPAPKPAPAPQRQAQVQEPAPAPAPTIVAAPTIPLPSEPIAGAEETAAAPAEVPPPPALNVPDIAIPESPPPSPVEKAPAAPMRLIPEGLGMKAPGAAPDKEGTVKAVQLAEAAPAAQAPRHNTAPAALLAPAPPAKAESVLQMRIELAGEDRILVLDWNEPQGAAAFRHGGHLWLVFDRAGRVERSAPDSAKMPAVERVALNGATAFRLPWPEETPVALGRRGTAWLLFLDAKDASAVDAIPSQVRSATETGTRLLLAAEAPGRPVDLSPALDGDRVIAVPVASPGRGMAQPRDFIQFALLPTAQGIVVRAKSDSVRVSATARGALIDAGSGLLLSGIGDGDRHLALRIEEWRRGGKDGYREQFSRLQHAVSDAPPNERPLARRQLAEFLFAHGLYAEALGVMTRIAEEDTSANDDSAFRLMRGAAQLGVGRIEDAAAELDAPTLGDSPEAALWRGMLAAERRLWSAAQKAFAAGVYVVDRYPPDMRAPFRLAMARTWIELKDARSARAELSALDAAHASQSDLALANVARGRAAALAGDLAEAKKHYKAAAESGDRRARPWAEMALVETELTAGRIDRAAAIEGLEKLRFAWRGDEFEFRLLDQLGHLHVDAGQYRDGFAMLRDAATIYPEEPRTPAITQKLRADFARLFLDGEADRLPPLVALGLFYEFREFTPAGGNGDRMIGRLADRLVEADLLDRAAELMEYLVSDRLAGPEKARTGARLAIAYMLDRKPEIALKALRASAAPGTPAALTAERRTLEARALADMGRFAEALAAISGDNDSAALATRADIHWRAKDWPAAAASLDQVLGERWNDPKPLDAGERRRVLQLAVAQALAGEAARMEKTRQRYVKAMDGTAEADAFAVVTSRNDHQDSHPLRLATAIARIDQLEAFMTSYRKKLVTPKAATN